VADLVVPVDDAPVTIALNPATPSPTAACPPAAPQCSRTVREVPAAAKPRTREDRLIKLIMTTVAPQSWDSMGGPGSIDYYPLGMALVINQTSDVQEQIADLLAALRRLNDQEVVLEFQMISLADDVLKQMSADWPAPSAAPDAPAGAPQVRFLDGKQVNPFMETIQADRRTSVHQAPKMTLLNGQSANVDLTDKQFFVTGVETVESNGQICFVPKSETCDLGLKLSAQPVISGDRKFVRLNLKVKQTELASSTIPLVPVTIPLEPQQPDGTKGAPVPFTQYIQKPEIDTHAVDVTLAIPDGGTALITGWQHVREGRNEYGPPVLSKIPYVSRLFRNVGYGRESEQVLIMVTPRVIVSEEKEEKVATVLPCPRAEPVPGGAEESEPPIAEKKPAQPSPKAATAREKKVVRLLKKYHQACADGRLEEAGKMARQALKLDPACFDK
jgi:type II secretory pathway component GspD/PulD (secretin)